MSSLTSAGARTRAGTLLRQGRRYGAAAMRRVRPLTRRVKLGAGIVMQRAQGRGCALLLSGSSEATYSRATRIVRLCTAARLPVTVLVLDFDSPAPHALAALPADAQVRYFWRWNDLPPTATGKTGEKAAELHYGSDGTPVRRDEYEGGVLVRSADLHPASGRDATHRYLDPRGTCWLSVWIGSDGRSQGRTQRHLPRLQEYPALRDAQVEWAVERLASTPDARLFALGSRAERIAPELNRSYATIDAGGKVHRHS